MEKIVLFEPMANNENLQERNNKLHALLGEHTCKVTFKKVNGEERILTCTLRKDILPTYEKNKESARAANQSTISVWNLDNSQWRSFRVMNVREVQVIA